MVAPRPRKLYGNEEVDKLIEEATSLVGSNDHDDLARSMIVTALDMDSAEVDRLEMKIASQSLAEIFNAWKVFGPYSNTPKVTIFGSARTKPDHEDYKLTVEFGKIMAERNWMAITGAGPGIMTAGIEGIGLEKAFGVNIILPFEQKAANIIEGNPKLATFKYFFTRKLSFMKESDAFVLFPGGFGTQDEAFELLTLIHTGKSYPAPVVFIDHPGSTYWQSWQKFVLEELAAGSYIDPDSAKTYLITNDPIEAADYISSFYSCYHSIRFVRGKLVIRLRSKLSDEALVKLNDEFASIIKSGAIEPCDASKAEKRDNDCLDLERICFSFDNKSFAKLILMIERINGLANQDKVTPVSFPHDISPEELDEEPR